VASVAVLVGVLLMLVLVLKKDARTAAVGVPLA
jgi:hypothetical protein